MVECIQNNDCCRLDKFYDIVDIACFLMLEQELLDNILLLIPPSEGKIYLKALHRLIINDYMDLVSALL